MRFARGFFLPRLDRQNDDEMMGGILVGQTPDVTGVRPYVTGASSLC